MKCLSRHTNQSFSAPEHANARGSEQGYLMIGAGVLILFIVAMLSTFAFTSNRDTRFKGHFAAGQRVAELATMAHFYAQSQHYGPPGLALNGVLLYSSEATTAYMSPPDGFAMHAISGIRYEVAVRGTDNAPVNASIDPELKAASAYLHVKVRPLPGRTVSASDRVAFMSGANKRGLSRVGIVDNSITATDTCDGAPTRVRWGPEISSCLNTSEINSDLGFTDVQPGDVIIPVWETALANAKDEVLYRFKQPLRPDMNSMATNLLMESNPVDSANETTTNNINSSGTSMIGDGSGPNDQMLVRYGSQTTLNGHATTNTSFEVHDNPQDGTLTNSMQVAGPVNFNNGTNINVGNTLQYNPSAAPLNVRVNNANGFGTDVLQGETGVQTVVSPVNTGDTLNVAVKNVPMGIPSMEITGANSRLAVVNRLDTTGAQMKANPGGQLNMYGAQITTKVGTNASIAVTNPQASQPWKVGAIEQNGTGAQHYLHVDKVLVNSCEGLACPDFVTQGPQGGVGGP